MFKFIVIGDTGVGKSCMLLYFIDKRFRTDHELTIGVEFGTKTITTKGKTVKLQVWDTAGQDSFRSIIRSYYRGACGALLVYDVSRRDSFDSLGTWLTDTRQHGNPDMVIILCANKIDLEDQRVVSEEEGREWAARHDMLYIETSAKMGDGVDSSFNQATEQILDKIQNGSLDLEDESNGVRLGKKSHASAIADQQEKKSGCCN